MSYFEYASRFIAIGFIAGSIVHLGEGVNVWDISVLIIGIALFLWTSVRSASGEQFDTPAHRARFIGFSFLLAVGIGMASGGFQHFVDTPEYSAILIPSGLLVGYVAYEASQGRKLAAQRIMMLVLGAACFGFVMNWIGHIFVDLGLAAPHVH
jgi:hypothetical protein